MWEDLEKVAQRLAPAREHKVDLLAAAERTYGVELGGELRAWISLFERYELETAEPGFTELRTPDATLSLRSAVQGDEPSFLAQLLGMFSGAAVIAQEDELSYLASWSPTASGVSKVYHFHPDDWGLWPTDPSITIRFFRWAPDADEAERMNALRDQQRHEVLDPRLDPERYFPRLAWLVHFFLGVGGEFRAELARAGTIRDYHQERDLISTRPNLALYWLWSHHVLGNDEELREVLRLSESVTSAPVKESRELIRALEDHQDVRLGMRQGAIWATLREQIREAGHAALFSAGAQKRIEERDRSAHANIDEEDRAWAVLREAAVREPRVKEALDLFAFFEEGGALKESVLQVRYGLDLDAAIDKFAALIDARFRQPILLRLRRAAKYPDASPHATHGLLRAFAKLAKNYGELEQVIDALGTSHFGPRRMAELCRAYAKFDDPRATQRLAAMADAYLAEIESWEPKAPKEAVLELFERDVPEMHEVIAALLEKASFSGANAALCLRAVEAAERWRSKRAVAGLMRAIERELGRIDDGGREHVVRALVACAGADAAPVFDKAIAARAMRWQEDAERDASYVFFHKDIAVWLGGWLEAAPEEPRAIDKAREVLSRFHQELALGSKARRDLLNAIMALFRGVARGRVYALVDAVEPWCALAIAEDRGSAGLGDRVRALAAETSAL